MSGPWARLCGSCRGLARDGTRREEVLNILEKALPVLGRAALLELVTSAAATSRELGSLHRHLLVHPDALSSGSPSAPRVVCRLAAAASATGATVACPRCAACGKERLLVTATLAGRICQPCYASTRTRESCSRCRRLKPVHARIATAPVCKACHGADPSSWSPCAGCGRLARVVSRSPLGPLCQRCHRPPHGNCGQCGAFGVVRRRGGRLFCPSCYAQFRPRRPCGRCGHALPVNRRARDGEPDLCDSCNRSPNGTCSRCGSVGPITGRRTGALICRRCSLTDRVDALLSADGTIPDALSPLREALITGSSPDGALSWLKRSSGAHALVELRHGVPLTHDFLDAVPTNAARSYLRSLLVAAGTLPALDIGEQLRPETERLAAAIEVAEDRRTFDAFVRWHVLRRLRTRATNEPATGLKYPKMLASTAVCFIASLSTSGHSLATCQQEDLDRFLATHPAKASALRVFLDFCATRHEVSGIELPRVRRKAASSPAEHDERWALARRLLHGGGIEVDDRVAGTLVVLYAQPVTRIARLRKDQLLERDGTLFIGLGVEPLELHEPLVGLLRQLPHRRDDGASARFPSPWLFPGRLPGHPVNPESLRKRLARLGVVCRAQRSAALLQLGGELPVRVIADLLGIGESTAERWVNASGGRWGSYAGLRGAIAENS